ncbi:MAG: NAD(+) diphosphatase [Pseudomonadota bacterium]
MISAETVTFGGSGLDRAAEMRGRIDPSSVEKAEIIVLWRGKPLVCATALDRLLRLPPEHPIFADSDSLPILLGRNEDRSFVFARSLDTWQPNDLDEAQVGGFVDPSEQRHPVLPEGVFAELRRIMTRLSSRDAELAATAKAIAGWHRSHGFCSKCGVRSDMTQSGWQRTCPACGAHHFPRVDPVVIMLVTRGNRVLLGRSPGWPDGMFSCLAGFVEPGETIEAAVRREVKEEAGVDIGQVSYLACQPWAFPSSLMIGCHGVAVSDEITIDPNEIEEAIWISREELVQAFAGEHDRIKPAREGAIAHFLLRHWLSDTL